jgi:hypothetical protein
MPYYMEAELNSPMVRLEPGETYAFDTKWFPTRATADFKTVTDAGVVNRALAATASGQSILLTGSFGVFFPGSLAAYVFDARGVKTAVVPIQPASPLELVNVQQEIPGSSVDARVSLHLIDQRGADRGSLGEATISKAEHTP